MIAAMKGVRSAAGFRAQVLLAALVLAAWHLDCACEPVSQQGSITCGCVGADHCAAHHGPTDCTVVAASPLQLLSAPPVVESSTPTAPQQRVLQRLPVLSTPIRAGPALRRTTDRAPPQR